MKFTAFIHQADTTEPFSVVVPALRGCAAEGESREDALDNARAEIRLWLREAGREAELAGAEPTLELIDAESLERGDDELRRALELGLNQLDRGEYVEYTDETLPGLFEGIKRRGRERLNLIRSGRKTRA